MLSWPIGVGMGFMNQIIPLHDDPGVLDSRAGNAVPTTPPPVPPTRFDLIPYYVLNWANTIEQRYQKNRGIEQGFPDRLIFGQGNADLRGISVGPRGNFHDHGCGPIAVFNALYYATGGTPQSLAAIIRDLELAGGFSPGGGNFGTMPNAIISVINDAGFGTSDHLLPTLQHDLDNLVRGSAVSILLYTGIGKQGISNFVHYSMVRYFDGGFYLYNAFPNDEAARRLDSISERQSNYTNISIITIDSFVWHGPHVM
jgi:hypothetical protein